MSPFVTLHIPYSPWHWITRARRHPGHAAEQARGGEPEAFRETVREHRFLGIVRASRLEPAMDITVVKRLQNQPVPSDHPSIVNDNRDLLPRRPHPIANRRGGENNRGDPNDPSLAASRPRYLKLVHGDRPPILRSSGVTAHRETPKCRPSAYGLGAPGIVFGRVTRWMIQPINQVNGIQVSTFTKPAFGDWRRFASFVTQIAAQSQRPR